LRGWFDDGTALGSATGEECRIDSIAQAWAVISGAADEERATRAMAAVERELIHPQDGLALLFAPPFDQTRLDPGYIKGYPPGIRENGGQYTHAAAWSVMAFAGLGQGDKAVRLFSLINPINHARSRAGVQRYKVEPYVVAADVYANPRHVGRGDWTWYTGSAGVAPPRPTHFCFGSEADVGGNIALVCFVPQADIGAVDFFCEEAGDGLVLCRCFPAAMLIPGQ
jgi:cyclic beta-1,2-glucan synthetase